MARNVETPDHVDIRSLRKENVRIGNLLEPGPGTPWEDRGAVGVVSAFFKTWRMMLTSPGALLASLRRPETSSDARAFALICCFFWGVAWVIYDYLAYRAIAAADQRYEWEFAVEGYLWIFHFALGFAGSFVMLKLVTRLFYKLASAGEMRQKFPQVLAVNVYGYCMAPSLFAVIVWPYLIGPAIALVWIFGLCLFASASRLAIKKSGVIICNTIAFVGVVGGLAAAYHLLRVIYKHVLP